MRRNLSLLTVALIVAVTLSACGKSDYCQSVEGNKDQLNSFATTKSNKAYSDLANTMRTLGGQAPESVKDDYKKLADTLDGVVAAQEKAGVKLEDLNSEKVADLSTEQQTILNEAYTAFNKTTDQRAAVVTNIKQECEITLR